MENEAALPRINGLAGKVMALERRRDFLRDQVERGAGSPGALQFSRKEIEALDAAVDALKYHRAVVNGLDDPLSLLRELLEACNSGDDKASLNAMNRARIVLDEYGA